MRNLSVKVLQGIVRGCEEKLPNGKSYLRFSGIPYAKKPINELRFKAPEKLVKFDKPEIDCLKEGSDCFQKSQVTGKYIGSEDCLYLNVYVPEIADSAKLAVMVFIHGGAFAYGSSSVQMYSPEYLLMEDVIVVTINYRLRALGFLSLPSMGISGNAGLKDQQMALEWVYENISNFNGDPNNICLFGESAGAASVHFHVLNKKSRKFIKSAICQSGSALSDWALQRNPIEKTKRLAKLLGCSNPEDDREVYKTLMSSPLESLDRCAIKAGTIDDKRRGLDIIFSPCIELPSRDAFMTKTPLELIKNESIDIPIMFGTNDKDGMINTAYLKDNLDVINKDLVRMVPISVNISPDSSLAVELGKKVKRFYFCDKDIGEDNLVNHFDLSTDLNFLIPQTICNELHARYHHNCNQFLYEFSFDGELNLLKQILQMGGYKGACHADELFYLFGQQLMDIDPDENSSTYKMRAVMCKLWTNFAKYKHPTPQGNNPLNVTWNPVKHVDRNEQTVDLDYLIINSESRMQKNLNEERLNFWRNVYKTWNSEFIKSKF